MRCHHSLDIRRNPRTTKLHWAGRRELRRVYRGRRPPRLHRSGSTSTECHGTLQFTRTLRRTTGETPDPKGPQHIREHCRRVAKLPHRATAAPRIRADQRLTKFITGSRAQTSSLSLTITLPSSHFFAHIHFYLFSFRTFLHPTPASICMSRRRGEKTRYQEYLSIRWAGARIFPERAQNGEQFT
jgi:hypothetical protein